MPDASALRLRWLVNTPPGVNAIAPPQLQFAGAIFQYVGAIAKDCHCDRDPG
jgi:hypothetical protein